MSIDATFWVAIAFFIFFGGLFYLKVPQKVNTSLNEKINIQMLEFQMPLQKFKSDAIKQLGVSNGNLNLNFLHFRDFLHC